MVYRQVAVAELLPVGKEPISIADAGLHVSVRSVGPRPPL